jgi:hypothetical protein
LTACRQQGSDKAKETEKPMEQEEAEMSMVAAKTASPAKGPETPKETRERERDRERGRERERERCRDGVAYVGAFAYNVLGT